MSTASQTVTDTGTTVRTSSSFLFRKIGAEYLHWFRVTGLFPSQEPLSLLKTRSVERTRPAFVHSASSSDGSDRTISLSAEVRHLKSFFVARRLSGAPLAMIWVDPSPGQLGGMRRHNMAIGDLNYLLEPDRFVLYLL